MNRSIYSLFSIPVIYSAFSVYKGSTLSDALIITALCGVISFFAHVVSKEGPVKQDDEVTKLEKELHLNRLKANIERMKEETLADKARRDSARAAMGYEEGKQIRF